jgi:hypothetical protein
VEATRLLPPSGLAAIGNKHLTQVGSANLLEWYYTVTIRNETTEVFDQVVVFYGMTNVPAGVGIWREWIFAPGDVRVFNLGICKYLKDYVVGFYLGDDLVSRFPDQGTMTPELASQVKPSDAGRCTDSWVIG